MFILYRKTIFSINVRVEYNIVGFIVDIFST